MNLRKAAEMALEALENLQGCCTDSDDGTVEAITVWCPEIIDALREALAQPELEPVIAIVSVSNDYHATIDWMLNPCPAGTELYLHPAPIPEGWQLVPKSTTCDMDSAGSKAHYKNWDGSPIVTESDAESIYKAMLAAAPRPEDV